VGLSVQPGARVRFAFTGDRLGRAARATIASLYRTDFYEPIAREEVRQAAVRALRAEGHVDPAVTVEVDVAGPAGAPDATRTVTVHADAGPRRGLDQLVLAGLEAEEARLAAASFPGRLARAELAAGEPAADRRLLAALQALGYPQATLAGRTVADGGARLVVDVVPGPRQTLAAVEVMGVDGDERERLAALLALAPGDAARADRIAQGARRLEADLHARGFADATVRSTLVPVWDRPRQSALAYQVAPGTAYRLAAVELIGQRWSRPGLVRGAAELEPGGVFSDAAVEEARNRLFATGLFSRVDATTRREGDEARVTFDLGERPRFRFDYGVQWESDLGASAVVDFVDHNFLGRGLALGLRGLYQRDDVSGRLHLRSGGLLGTRVSLEGYAEARRETLRDENLVEDRREVALQASRPLGEASSARLYLRYRATELYEVEPDPFFPFAIEIVLPYLGLQLVRDSRDDAIDPGRGLLTSVDLSGSGRFLDSDFEYLRLFAQAAAFHPLPWGNGRWTWAQALRLGVARPLGGQELIGEERFFAGGPLSVRGYPREGLGPRESLGDFERITGGEALLTLNQELRLALPWDLTGLLFFDAGQVWTRPADADLDLAKSLGLGVRARTPLGLVRFDAAYPLDGRPGDDRYRLYLGFGNAF
jgi:outer membrane protein assembly factor BamA